MDISHLRHQDERSTHFRYFENASPDTPSMGKFNNGDDDDGRFVDVDTLELVESLNGEAVGICSLTSSTELKRVK